MAPGVTSTKLASGGANWRWVAAVEGYPYLLTDATPSQATTAWSGTDWTEALTGLLVDARFRQRISPWEPFPAGSEVSLIVLPQGHTGDGDRFGTDTHRTTQGDETVLTAAADPDDTTFTVASTTGFDASGSIYRGVESIEYTGVTATTFTGLTRGLYSPFTTDGGARFGRSHRLRQDPHSVAILPAVTSQPRTWRGRYVGLWLHQYDASAGTLNTKADALLVYAGRIAELRDDPESMGTIVDLESIQDCVKRAVIGKDLWTATVKEGVEIKLGMEFDARDWGDDTDGGTLLTANSLVAVAGAAANANEISAGFYGVEELYQVLNNWFASERAASRLNGSHWLTIGLNSTVPLSTWFNSEIPGAGPFVRIEFRYPEIIDRVFGRMPGTHVESDGRRLFLHDGDDDVAFDSHSNGPPLRNVLDFDFGFEVYDEIGTFVDQSGTLPAIASAKDAIFLVDGSVLIHANKVGDEIQLVTRFVGSSDPGVFEGLGYEIPLNSDRPEIEIKQVLVTEDTRGNLLKKLLYSTGATGFNHATLDTLPAAMSIGIPGELLGDNFEQSVDALPGANDPVMLVLSKPQKLEDLIGGDLQLCWSYLRWKDEGLQFSTWQTPTTGVVLSESNKAVPAADQDHQLSATILTDEFTKTTVKIQYNRSWHALNDEYRDDIIIVDPGAADEAGTDELVRTIKCNTCFSEIIGTGTHIETLASRFKDSVTMFTRGVRLTTRTIDSRLFQAIAVGDCVLVTDDFARDPDTGMRGVATRPGIVVAHSWSLGGPMPGGGVDDVHGEVQIMFRDILRNAPYAPCAQVASYVIGTKIATITAHAHSEASEAVDASHFPVGAKVKWIERDPADPAAPATHDDTIAGNSGNTLTMTTGFALYDSNKVYRIISDAYGDASAVQQAGFSYQADSDHLIQDTRAPFRYGIYWSLGTFTANAANDPVELPPNVSYGDGAPRDVGHEAATLRLLNNLIDWKTPHSKPSVQQDEMAPSGIGTASFQLLDLCPVNIGALRQGTSVPRTVSIAPFFKSSDGASASVRVTYARNKPSGTSVNDVDRGSFYSSATFTTTSTTYATATPQTLDLGSIADIHGDAWLLIELSEKARCRGLGEFQIGARAA